MSLGTPCPGILTTLIAEGQSSCRVALGTCNFQSRAPVTTHGSGEARSPRSKGGYLGSAETEWH